MQKISIEKVVINMGVGSDADKMKRGEQIMKLITGRKVIKTHGKKRIPDWGVRPGVQLGLKITLRGNKAMEFLKEAFKAKDNKIKAKSFDKEGNFGFGVREHIELPGIKYDPKLGILGFDVLVTLKKIGYRVKVRKIKRKKIGKNQRVTKEEAINFVKEIGVELQ
ncbi:MAG: 50S ribosomal protein L5 [Candidatus ainarchaeum sp.]|nr:50S ribosomal protein L5 [Candidatus ainarchaeum sp.]